MARKKIPLPTDHKARFDVALDGLVHLVDQKGGPASSFGERCVADLEVFIENNLSALAKAYLDALARAEQAGSNITITLEECKSIVRILENIEALETITDECVNSNEPQSALDAIRVYVETIYRMDKDGAKESLYTELSNRLREATTGGQP